MKIHCNFATITDTGTIYTTQTRETTQKLHTQNEVNRHSDHSTKR